MSIGGCLNKVFHFDGQRLLFVPAMNVFEERRGQIGLCAPKGSRNAATIAILLEELKLPYRLRVLSKEKEPEGPVPPQARNGAPVLTNFQSDGEHVSISGMEDILEYLLRRYDEEYLVSYPKNSPEQKEVNGWMDLVSPHVNCHHESSPARFNLDAEDGIAFARKALSLYLNLEQHLQKIGGRFLVGNKCTIADFALFPYVAAAEDTGIDLERFPEVTSWYNRLLTHPAVERGMHAFKLDIGEV